MALDALTDEEIRHQEHVDRVAAGLMAEPGSEEHTEATNSAHQVIAAYRPKVKGK